MIKANYTITLKEQNRHSRACGTSAQSAVKCTSQSDNGEHITWHHRTTSSLDLKRTLSKNRLLGLWRMMTGFRLVYVAATICVGIAAMSRTGTFLLLRTLVDDVLGTSRFELLPLVALGFIGLAPSKGRSPFSAGDGPLKRRKASRGGCAITCSITSSGCRSPITITRRPAN